MPYQCDTIATRPDIAVTASKTGLIVAFGRSWQPTAGDTPHADGTFGSWPWWRLLRTRTYYVRNEPPSALERSPARHSTRHLAARATCSLGINVSHLDTFHLTQRRYGPSTAACVGAVLANLYICRIIPLCLVI